MLQRQIIAEVVAMSAGPVGARRHATMNGDSVVCDVRAEVIVVYLDNCAIINIAKDKSGLGERFLAAIEQGGEMVRRRLVHTLGHWPRTHLSAAA